MARRSFELKADQLRWQCDPKTFKFKTTADIEEKNEIIGQEKALKAMETGLSISSPGFNVYVSAAMQSKALPGVTPTTFAPAALSRVTISALRPSLAPRIRLHARPLWVF